MNNETALRGALTFDTVPGWFETVSGWFGGNGELTIDLAEVTRVDSAGLALLIECLRRARAANRPLRFTNAPQQLQTLAGINGLQATLWPPRA